MVHKYQIYLTEEQLANLTEEELAALEFQPPTSSIVDQSQEQINNLLEPLFVSSGIWADYNPTYEWYQEMLKLQIAGIINSSAVIPAPDVNDYPDLSSPRSARWLNGF